MSTPALPSLTSLLTYSILIPLALAILLVPATYIFTNIRYRRGLQQVGKGTGQIRSPVKIPYAIPVLGSALDFLKTKPGSFWTYLFSWHPYTTSAGTLKLGGRDMHLLHDPHAIHALFKIGDLHRYGFNYDVATKVFDVEHLEALRYHGYDVDTPASASEKGQVREPHEEEQELMTRTLLRTERVNELTTIFMKVLGDGLSANLTGGKQEVETNLYSFVRQHLFAATITSFFGSTCLEDYPGLEQDFFAFENNLLTMLFGIPRWMSPEVYRVRDRITANLVKWHERNLERTNGQIMDPDNDIIWDPVQGVRANRARYIYYRSRNLKLRSRAMFDLGFMFGIASNAIPAAGWVLMHILNPKGDKTLYARVMLEVESCKRPDGSIDVNVLIGAPLLNSILHEVLRFYSDFLLTRELPREVILPVGNGGDKMRFPKDGVLMAPAWLEHRNTALWPGHSADTFYAERFLTIDPETGKQSFSIGGTSGRFFPFGGGRSMCPGRVFAKQEILASVAMVLLKFDIEPLNFLDKNGREVDSFPEVADAFPGTAILTLKGDLKVKITKKG